MSYDKLEKIINESFEEKEKVGLKSDKKLVKAINETINLVDSGKIRVANKISGNWVVNQWIKKYLAKQLNGKRKIGKELDIVMFQMEL